MGRTLEDKIRETYEKFPYPTPGRKSSRDVADSLVPLPWLEAMAATSLGTEPRILVAGCGTGSELFYLAAQFRNAELIGIDFSPRTIACALRASRSLKTNRRIRFVCGDLSDSEFMRSFAGRFDFISCHGVISYVPKPVPVLRNLKRCLAPRGILYLGANGPSHFSVRYRAAAANVGLEIGSMSANKVRKRTFSMFDRLTGESVADRAPDFISSDVVAPFINNLPLAAWLELAEQVGLHFRGEYGAYRKVVKSLSDIAAVVAPRSRPDLHRLVRLLVPAVFHRMAFTKTPEPPINWAKKSLMIRPCLTGLYASKQTAQRLRLETQSLNLFIEIEPAFWEKTFLTFCSGKRTMREIQKGMPPHVSWQALRRWAFLFYQAGVLNFSNVGLEPQK